jgi:hypothetical protein
MIMEDHYRLFIQKAELPDDAVQYLTESGQHIFENCSGQLEDAISEFYSNGFDVIKISAPLQKISEAAGIDVYTVDFIFLVCASERMLADFRKKGYSDELFWDTIMDLKYKLFECKQVKGVWGNFVGFWYPIFYKLDLFKLGRLEFERRAFDQNHPVTVGGITVKPGDTVYSVHIPSSGSLSRELRIDSYSRAYNFFKDEIGDKPLICVCCSWLLNPDNTKIFPPHLNIIDFMDDWMIISRIEDPEFQDSWRIFGKEYDGNPSKLPQNTTMQKHLVEWLSKGGHTGYGYGIMAFDGKKILNY